MKNVLLKFAGLFVERVPVDERGNPIPSSPPGPRTAPGAAQPPAAAPQQAQPAMPHQHQQHMPAMQPAAGMPQQAQPLQGAPMQQHPGMPPQPGQPGAMPQGATQPIAVALRAWVPQEYAAHLAPHGVHVIAAGGSVTSEQARGWGADVLIVSAECLGQDTHLLQQPQLPTVLITPQPVMLPDVPGVLQVQEPLRASDVAHAARDAAAAYAAARR